MDEYSNMKPMSELAREKNIELDTLDPVVRGGFTQVPNFILRNEKISVGAKMAYAMFLSYAWNNEYCFPGQEKLAKDIGVSERSVRTYLSELEEHQLLTVTRRGLGKTNFYKLHFVTQSPRNSGGKKSTSLPDRQNLPVKTGRK
jgi:hypothetical protein